MGTIQGTLDLVCFPKVPIFTIAIGHFVESISYE